MKRLINRSDFRLNVTKVDGKIDSITVQRRLLIPIFVWYWEYWLADYTETIFVTESEETIKFHDYNSAMDFIDSKIIDINEKRKKKKHKTTIRADRMFLQGKRTGWVTPDKIKIL